MASNFNIKSVDREGKSELKIGVDENAKIIDGIGNEIIIKNEDGSPSKIASENIPYMPDDVSEENRLVSQKDLKEMMKNIEDIIDATNNLAKIVGGI